MNALVDKTAETQASQKLIKNEIWLIIVDTKIMSGGVSMDINMQKRK